MKKALVTKARDELSWISEITVEEMCKEMIARDIEDARNIVSQEKL